MDWDRVIYSQQTSPANNTVSEKGAPNVHCAQASFVQQSGLAGP